MSDISESGGVSATMVDDDDEEEEDGPVAPRKRSNSLPVPQIEVTACGAAGDDDGEKKDGGGNGDGKGDALGDMRDSGFHTRATSLGGGKRRKKSLISTGMEVTRLKHFKSFVESKILSKSDKSLADEEESSASQAAAAAATTNVHSTQETRSGQAGKNSFKRRSSRTSFTEFDPCSPSAPHTSAYASSQPTAASSSCRVST